MYNNGAKIVQRYKKESIRANKVMNKKVINNGITTYSWNKKISTKDC
tara:strand:+ start:41 stop:181 length:141 start_codon:yes stop_codon:yes gene_type:complete